MAATPKKPNEKRQDSGKKEASEVGATDIDPSLHTDEQFASYIGEALASLHRLANARGFRFLSYLLEMAALEAKNVKDGRDS